MSSSHTAAVLAAATAISPEFAAWVDSNLSLTVRFFHEADKVWLRGRRHYSARTIIEFIRHETSLSDVTDPAYKVNNNIVPQLARLYRSMNPERWTLFEVRNMRAGTTP